MADIHFQLETTIAHPAKIWTNRRLKNSLTSLQSFHLSALENFNFSF